MTTQTHSTHVYSDADTADGYFARCSCGWTSATTNESDAYELAAIHDEEVAEEQADIHTEDRHIHDWQPSSTFDTGHQPPLQRWDCECGEREWTDDPEGPES